MSGGFFRGTSADQDTRFSNKQAKLLKSQKFASELEHLVDTTKVKMDVIRPWIANRVTELIGFEDEVLINFICGLLEGNEKVNGKEIQIALTGFMERNTGKFMKELWLLLLSAQKNASGVPQEFLDAKEEETKRNKAELDRIANEVQKRHDKESRELHQERTKKLDWGNDVLKDVDSGMEPSSKHQGRTSVARPIEEKESEDRNGSRGRSRASKSPYSANHSSPRGMHSRSISKSFSNSRSYSDERRRSWSLSPSNKRRGPSSSSERVHRVSPRRSLTPHGRHSPRRSSSPKHRSSYSGRRSSSRSHRSSRYPVRYRMRHRSRSPLRHRSRSPIWHRPRSPTRRSSPWRRSLSPIRRRSSSVQRRSPSPNGQRSPSPIRRRYRGSPSPWRRSRSPVRIRSPSPIRHTSRSPVWRKSRTPIRHRSPSPIRSMPRSPVWRRSLSPIRRMPRSPVRHRSPSRTRRMPRSPVRRRSPSPIRRMPRSPVRRRSPSPIRRMSCSPVRPKSDSPSGSRSSREWSSASPVRLKSLSPIGRKSPKRQRSPLRSPRGMKRNLEKDLPVHRAITRNADVRTTDVRRRSLSVSEAEKETSSIEKQSGRIPRSYSSNPPIKAGEKILRDDSSGTSAEDKGTYIGESVKRSYDSSRKFSSPGQNKYSNIEGQSKDVSAESLGVHRPAQTRHPDRAELSKKEQALLRGNKSEKMEHQKRPCQQDPQKTRDTLLSEKRKDSPVRVRQGGVEKNHSHLDDSKINDQRPESLPKLYRKVEKNDQSPSVGCDSEQSDKNRAKVKDKRKNKRSEKRDSESGDESSYDSSAEERKDAKRRRKEEKKMRKEEKRRRREERRRRKEERRAEKQKLKSVGTVSTPSGTDRKLDDHFDDDHDVRGREPRQNDMEDTSNEQKKLEIQLREKAIELYMAKKGIGH